MKKVENNNHSIRYHLPISVAPVMHEGLSFDIETAIAILYAYGAFLKWLPWILMQLLALLARSLIVDDF